MKRIISTALTVIMLLSSIMAIIPVTAFAAQSAKPSTETEQPSLSLDELQQYIDTDYIQSNFSTAEEMLKYDQSKGYIEEVTSANGLYKLYVNRYSGFVYYQNVVTGQILTSNPIDPQTGASEENDRKDIMSQIIITFCEANNTLKPVTYNSVQWAARYSQISTSKISGGIRVNYTLGDTSTRFLLPGRISAENYLKFIIGPMINQFEELFLEAMTSVGRPDLAFPLFSDDPEHKWNPYKIYKDGTQDEFVLNKTVVENYLAYAEKLYADKTETEYDRVDPELVEELDALYVNINLVNTAYGVKNPKDFKDKDGNVSEIDKPSLDQMLKDYPVCETFPIYVFDEAAFKDNKISKLREYSGYIKLYCHDYTMEQMYADEKECGFEYTAAEKPVFRCALEYTFNSDGSLSVRLPANSITFDETTYILKNITPLQYFGYGDMSKDGYLFYPDGSGSILEFEDFYSDDRRVAPNLESKVYGQDYCYSAIVGAHREQITMPVYGMVTEANANATTASRYGVSTVDNGCFVIIEEGSSLASLSFAGKGSTHKYLAAFASYNPYPTDTYELSETISVGGVTGENTMTAENKYLGSYVSRIVMLTDSQIGEGYYDGNYYNSSYIGMATYYRDYLKANGTLTALEKVEENIPLYVETLGSMTILSKFLTFPVEKSIPLTTFEDVATMYRELANAKEHVKALANKYGELAETEENDLLKAEYLHKKEQYSKLDGQISDIKNVNFKLTGFANGGMNFTYPTKLKWEKCCGGSSGFEELIAESAEISAKDGSNFGIFPDFDFLYINNTASFDGISVKGNVSRMVDNRYASKQVYNSVIREFESFFTLVISSDTIKEHFATFNEKYSEFEHKKISVSTLGSDLNSNFDEKNTLSREDSKNNSVALLEEIAYVQQYEVMMDKGNVYAAEFATHILNASTTYSNFRYSSYSVPFVGMILHGYVNYAGSPLNYSGSPDYEILRAIESGANPYYILCYQNASYMKDDKVLNKYYGIDYTNWYDDILKTYEKLNNVLKGLQTYEIVDHKTVIVERVPEEAERLENYKLLKEELLLLLKTQLTAAIDAAVDAVAARPSDYPGGVKVVVDVEALFAQFNEQILSRYSDEIAADVIEADGESAELNALKEAIRQIAVEYANKYPGTAAMGNCMTVDFKSVKKENGQDYVSYREYSQYKFTTDSFATDGDDYDATDYTLDNGNVVIVTYKKGNDVKRFVLNYNLFDVYVKVDDGRVVPVKPYDFFSVDFTINNK